MVIDDDPSMLWFVSEIFTEKATTYSLSIMPKGIRQPGATTARSHHLRRDDARYRWVILHLHHPSNTSCGAIFPLILLSALHHEDDQVKGLESGADAYVTKPFNVKYLEKMVYHLIRREENLEYYSSALSTFTWKRKLLAQRRTRILEKMTEVIERT